jgi:hypothetical protein
MKVQVVVEIPDSKFCNDRKNYISCKFQTIHKDQRTYYVSDTCRYECHLFHKTLGNYSPFSHVPKLPECKALGEEQHDRPRSY